MIEELQQKISELTELIVQPLNIDLVAVYINRHGKNITIDIRADRPRGGITIDECADINKKIINEIETSGIINSPYSLTVASPGVDWPLTTVKDFLRVLNKKVRFHLKDAIAEKIEYMGTINGVTNDQVLVQIKEAELMIPIQNIKKAVQII